MTEQEKKIQELLKKTADLTRENVILREYLTKAVEKACFNCEEYVGHKEERCDRCQIKPMKEI